MGSRGCEGGGGGGGGRGGSRLVISRSRIFPVGHTVAVEDKTVDVRISVTRLDYYLAHAFEAAVGWCS